MVFDGRGVKLKQVKSGLARHYVDCDKQHVRADHLAFTAAQYRDRNSGSAFG